MASPTWRALKTCFQATKYHCARFVMLMKHGARPVRSCASWPPSHDKRAHPDASYILATLSRASSKLERGLGLSCTFSLTGDGMPRSERCPSTGLAHLLPISCSVASPSAPIVKRRTAPTILVGVNSACFLTLRGAVPASLVVYNKAARRSQLWGQPCQRHGRR